jgi:hypothetical protein
MVSAKGVTMRIELTEDQARRFRARLLTFLEGFRHEIARTEDKTYRHELLLDEEVLEAVLRQLEKPPVL